MAVGEIKKYISWVMFGRKKQIIFVGGGDPQETEAQFS